MRASGHRAALLAAALLLAACGNAAPRQDAATGAAPLPPDIARALQTDERVLDCAQAAAAGGSAFAPDWVRAYRVDLDGQAERDWIVEGLHPCLRGDGLSDWWLYADDGQARRLLGRIRGARAVEVLPARTRGHADLRVDTPAGTRILRYRDAGY